MKKILFLMVVMAMVALGAQAQETESVPQRHSVPAYKGMIEREQPNGYKLRTFLRGDEHRHWMMTEDGWQIIETDKGWIKYAKLNKKGEVVCHWRKAKNAEDRSKYAKRWLKKHGIKKVVA